MAERVEGGFFSAGERFFSRRTVRWFLIVCLVCTACAAVYRAVGLRGDFDGFYGAGRHVVETRTLLEDKSVERYPPTFHVLMVPFGVLPLWLAASIWMALNVWALVRLPRVIERLTGVPAARQWPAWFLVAPFVMDNVLLQQSGPLLMWMVLLGLAWARERRATAGVFLIGVTGLTKVIPIAFVAVPFLLRRWRGVIVGVLLTALLAVGLLAVGVGFHEGLAAFRPWHEGVTKRQSAWGLVSAGRSIRYNNQGLAVSLARTFGPEDIQEGLKHSAHVAELPLKAVWAIYGVIAGVVALAWFACAWKAFRRPTDEAWGIMTALCAGGMLMASALVWTHYFIWLLPMAVVLLHRPRLVMAFGIAAWLALGSRSVRSMGPHIAIAVSLYFVIARDYLLARRAEDVVQSE